MRRLGPKTVPVVARGAAYAMGLDLAEVAKLVGIAPPDAAQLTPGELVERLETVLAATGRYMCQIPDARLGDGLPGRDRSLRELGHHVFVIADAFLDVTRGDVLTAERLAVAPEEWMRIDIDGNVEIAGLSAAPPDTAFARHPDPPTIADPGREPDDDRLGA